ncbi:MAG: HIT family protein [Bacteroidetes bacterium]|nr:HIT family protein [Bacteroidota bacterium]
MSSIFSKIVAGEIPCHKIAENQKYFSFLDIRPLSKGHTLVIPKAEIDYVFDLEDEHLSGLMTFAKKIAKGIESVVPCERIGLSVVGLEVPHAHVHLIPINKVSDMSFERAPIEMSQEELAELAAAIRTALA